MNMKSNFCLKLNFSLYFQFRHCLDLSVWQSNPVGITLRHNLGHSTRRKFSEATKYSTMENVKIV